MRRGSMLLWLSGLWLFAVVAQAASPEEANEERVKTGSQTIEVLGWAEAPATPPRASPTA